jgi:hypothetical protein
VRGRRRANDQVRKVVVATSNRYIPEVSSSITFDLCQSVLVAKCLQSAKFEWLVCIRKNVTEGGSSKLPTLTVNPWVWIGPPN